MRVTHSVMRALPHNFRGEIDLVVRRPNARTQLHNEILRSAAESVRHQLDRSPDNAELCSIFS